MPTLIATTDPKLDIHVEGLHKPLLHTASVPAFADIAKPSNDVSPLADKMLFHGDMPADSL